MFLTGHTGFKGAWLSIWLNSLGAEVTGYALRPPTTPSLFRLCRLDRIMRSIIGDVRDTRRLEAAVLGVKPDIIIHMAAQAILRESYKTPRETYETNVMGPVNIFEAARKCTRLRVLLNVTTDKCYENTERLRGYREGEPLGGYDPYSNSKACSELVTAAYRSSFFNSKDYRLKAGRRKGRVEHGSAHHVAVASARAGNVIGGGDWASDRLIPDIIRAALKGEKVRIRNPRAVRPWQHVLEPLNGYLLLSEKLHTCGPRCAGAWNFGPDAGDARNVEWLAARMFRKWSSAPGYSIDKGRHPHEAHYLRLDSSKARRELGWTPRWNAGMAVDKIIEWTLAYQRGEDILETCLRQIREYSRG